MDESETESSVGSTAKGNSDEAGDDINETEQRRNSIEKEDEDGDRSNSDQMDLESETLAEIGVMINEKEEMPISDKRLRRCEETNLLLTETNEVRHVLNKRHEEDTRYVEQDKETKLLHEGEKHDNTEIEQSDKGAGESSLEIHTTEEASDNETKGKESMIALTDPEVENEDDSDDIVLASNVESENTQHELPNDSHQEDENIIVTEDSPVVVKRRPISLHMESVFDQQVIKEEQPIVIIKQRVSLQVFKDDFANEAREANTIEMTMEPHPGASTSDTNFETAENQFDVTHEVRGKDESTESAADSRTPIEETVPFLVENKPINLEMERVLETIESLESSETVKEDALVVIEKRPVSLHMEGMFDEDGIQGKTVDNDSMKIGYKERQKIIQVHVNSTEGKKEAENMYNREGASEGDVQTELSVGQDTILEASSVVKLKRPFSFQMEVKLHLAEQREVCKAVNEVSPGVVVKRPVSLHMETIYSVHPFDEQMIKKEKDEAGEESVQAQLVDMESDGIEEILEHSQGLAGDAHRENEELVEETLPVALEKRPVSLHVEELLEDDNPYEPKEPKEAPSSFALEGVPILLQSLDQVFDIGEARSEEAGVEAKGRKLETQLVVTEEEKEEEMQDIIEYSFQNSDGNHLSSSNNPADTKRPISCNAEPVVLEESPKVEIQMSREEHASDNAESKDVDVGLKSVKKTPNIAEERTDGSGHKWASDYRVPIEDVTPVVVERRTLSLHIENIIVVGEGTDGQAKEVEDKYPGTNKTESLADEFKKAENALAGEVFSGAIQDFTEREAVHTMEPVHESEAVAIENRPVSFHAEQIVHRLKDSFKDQVLKSEGKGVDNIAEYHEGFVQEDNSSISFEMEEKTVFKLPGANGVISEPVLDSDVILAANSPLESEPELSTKSQEAPIRDQLLESEPEQPHQKPDEENSEVKNEVSVDEDVEEVMERKPEVEEAVGSDKQTEQAEAGVHEPSKGELGAEMLANASESQYERPEESSRNRDENEKNFAERSDNLKVERKQTIHYEQVVKSEELISRVDFEEGTRGKGTDLNTRTVTLITADSTHKPKEEEKGKLTSRLNGFWDQPKVSRLRDDAQHVLKKRLSAPEVLPEKENEGPAPLAASEDRGILESREQFVLEKPEEAANSDPGLKREQLPEDVGNNWEVSPENYVEPSAECTEEPSESDLPHLILITPEEEGVRKGQKKKRKRGENSAIHSPSTKCCSLM